MKKYYALVEVNNEELSLVIHADDINKVESKIYKSYRVDSIIEISEKPFRLKGKEVPSVFNTSLFSSSHSLGSMNSGNRISKRMTV